MDVSPYPHKFQTISIFSARSGERYLNKYTEERLSKPIKCLDAPIKKYPSSKIKTMHPLQTIAVNKSFLSLFCAVLLISACAAPPSRSVADTAISPPPTAPVSQTTPARKPVETTAVQPSPTSQPATATTPPMPQLCSPLQDIPLEQLPQIVSNPFHPPAAGSDDPHQGVDLAVVLPNTSVAISGHPVQAALAGRVAAVIKDRYPYGNALLIEVPLADTLTSGWQPAQIPSPAPTLENHSALTCPVDPQPQALDPQRRSLYVLYAHMLQPVQLNVGDPVTCGQILGAVGSSGNALNPHLHFETRVGPSAFSFTSMAHYDNSATSAEMSIYCLWRISGLFQLVDPLKILALHP
jgi:murein DD-endopeptidase MepM/ murein hydrolase activator NlpD